MTKEKLQFDLTQYESVGEFADSNEMFWSDLYLHQSSYNGLWYIQDTNQGEWYSLETRYDYLSDFNYLIENNITVTFFLIEDNDILKELENEFN